MLSPVLIAGLTLAAPPATRVAVLIDDPAPSAPAQAALESTLQARGFEVVAAQVSSRMREVIAPSELLGNRLPEGLSVFEADAILAGAASYGENTEVEGVLSAQVSLTARLIDLGTGRTTTTIQTHGVGLGLGGPALAARGAQQAVEQLFGNKRFGDALKSVGQSSGSVTLIVQGVPDRDSLQSLRMGLEKALAGAPVKEVYFAKGLGKLILGGSKARSMVGPDVADIIGEHRHLALAVDEVANTRIVATFDRARTVRVHALVLQPKVPKRMRKRAGELGKYVATKMATFDFARASYQPGKLSRKRALARAAELEADVLVESEVLGTGKSAALAIRGVDVSTGRRVYRQKMIIDDAGEELKVADAMLAVMGSDLPTHLLPATATPRPVTDAVASPTHASKE